MSPAYLSRNSGNGGALGWSSVFTTDDNRHAKYNPRKGNFLPPYLIGIHDGRVKEQSSLPDF